MSLLDSKQLALSARRLETVQKLLSDIENLKRQVTSYFVEGMLDKAACQQARIGVNHIETGLRAFALAEEKAYERAGGEFMRQMKISGGMLRGK